MDRSDMIFELLKSLNDKQDKQSEVLTRVEADLNYHIRRTDLLEGITNDIQYEVTRKIPLPSLKQIATVVGLVTAIVGLAVTFGL